MKLNSPWSTPNYCEVDRCAGFEVDISRAIIGFDVKDVPVTKDMTTLQYTEVASLEGICVE
jgi:hypothetical protein